MCIWVESTCPLEGSVCLRVAGRRGVESVYLGCVQPCFFTVYGCIRKLKNAAFGGCISRQEGIKARPNPKLASLPVS